MDKSAFVGAWRLVSETEQGADGVIVYPRGENPPGLLIYQADGVMAVQLMRHERSGDIRDLDTALDQYLGYFGRYSIDQEKQAITHHLEGSSYLPYVGIDLVRHFAFASNRLTLTAEVVRHGQTLTRVLVWERV
jgi:hypothetical protein